MKKRLLLLLLVTFPSLAAPLQVERTEVRTLVAKANGVTGRAGEAHRRRGAEAQRLRVSKSHSLREAGARWCCLPGKSQLLRAARVGEAL
jgi:hypothetical protein